MKKLTRHKKLISFLFILICAALILISLDLFARAGGAGGSSGGGGFSSSGSSGGGDGGMAIYLIFQLIRIILLLPFPFNIIALAILAFLAFYVYRSFRENSAINDIPFFSEDLYQPKKQYTPAPQGVDNDDFLHKAESAFYKIQKAWEAKDTSQVRIFLSDGVYQRFNTQFLMMNLAGQTNYIHKVDVKHISIDAVEEDGDFDIIHTAIDAYIEESFSSEHKGMTQKHKEYFREYWSFIRKKGAPKKDIYSGDRCPNCDALLPKEGMGEVSKCEYCNAIINSGEFDWVLAEITQAQDYSIQDSVASKRQRMASKLTKLSHEYADFSIQHVEDIASNAYLQILSAQTLKKPEMARRFSSDSFYSHWMSNIDINGTSKTVYNRLYLNAVILTAFHETGDHNIAICYIKKSYQRIRIDENRKVSPIDNAVISDNIYIALKREKNGENAKASLYAHMCPACGGPVSDTADLACSYCGSSLNNPAYEWIVDGIFSASEYKSYVQNLNSRQSATVKEELFDSVYDTRDFAFNNIMAVIACDGVFTDEEREFASYTAKKFGYNTKKIDTMFELAKNGRLSVRMPEDRKKREKIVKLMERAAKADNDYSDTEKAFIESIRTTYL